MKNKLIILSILLMILIGITGCDSNSKKLTCTVTETKDGRTTKSDLEAKIKNEEIEDMTLTIEVELPPEQQAYKQQMVYQIRQKTNQVYLTTNGIRAIFGMDSSYFNTLGVTKDVSYGELKQVLELQGYTCKG